MTDPVDTDALRAKVASSDAPDGEPARDVTALADEVDRLRADLNASMAMHEQARLLAGSALVERNRLRAVIENAPHREKCRPEIACTCWKADAL